MSQESFGESIQRNMSWAGYDRALTSRDAAQSGYSIASSDPAMRVGLTERRAFSMRSRRRCRVCVNALGREDQTRLDEHLSSIRDLERAIATLPPEYGVSIRRKPMAI